MKRSFCKKTLALLLCVFTLLANRNSFYADAAAFREGTYTAVFERVSMSGVGIRYTISAAFGDGSYTYDVRVQLLNGEYDAPDIEASDLGVAIGTGKEINLSSGDIVLVTDDLLDVVRAMKLSRFSVRNLRQSVAFAYTYNTVAIVFAAGLLALFTGVTMMPAAAAIFMCASQVLVALNSLRVKRIRI